MVKLSDGVVVGGIIKNLLCGAWHGLSIIFSVERSTHRSWCRLCGLALMRLCSHIKIIVATVNSENNKLASACVKQCKPPPTSTFAIELFNLTQKPGVPYVGHKQIEQTHIGCRNMRRLIRQGLYILYKIIFFFLKIK